MVKESRQEALPPLPRGVPEDPRHATANALHSAAVRLLRRARTADVDLDLDGPRASLLSVLAFRGPLPMTTLAEIEQVSPPAITKLVAALEERDLAERRRSDSDRRVVLVDATPTGRALLDRGRAARVAIVADLLDELTGDELRALRDAAHVVAGLLAARPGRAL
jgi:DNA-binding MarR family transcriptional regulator